MVIGNMSAYCASKGGLVQLTKAMALEFLKYNIQVNAICPGYFSTPMSRRMYKPEVWSKIARRKVPMGRIGKPEELIGANAVKRKDILDRMSNRFTPCRIRDQGDEEGDRQKSQKDEEGHIMIVI